MLAIAAALLLTADVPITIEAMSGPWLIRFSTSVGERACAAPVERDHPCRLILPDESVTAHGQMTNGRSAFDFDTVLRPEPRTYSIVFRPERRSPIPSLLLLGGAGGLTYLGLRADSDWAKTGFFAGAFFSVVTAYVLIGGDRMMLESYGLR